MSRRFLVLALIVVVGLFLGLLGLGALLFARGYFTVAEQNTPLVTASAAETVSIIVPTASAAAATATASSEATATISPTATTQPAATAVPPTTVPPTAIPVSSTSVQYVMAQTNVNIRSGPGTGFDVAGWLAEGQTARVTGVSAGGDWWRVLCPDGSAGSCWVSAGPRYTLPTTSPDGRPTDVASTCTDSASLVADVTVPDGALFEPNTGFNKVWRVMNTGTCIWDSSYRVVHAGGHLLGAVSSYFPLRDSVFPGQSTDLTISMVSPATPDTYQSDWKLQNARGQYFGVGRNSAPLWVKITVVGGPVTTISGLVYQDSNQNGVYDSGEMLLGGRVVWLIPGTACQVRQDPLATAISDGSGRYNLSGHFSGNYCVGLSGDSGLEDVIGVAVAAGQTLNNINLHIQVPSGSISGFLWNDYCLTDVNGNPLAGNCVLGISGAYQADGMIEPEETYIVGVTALLQYGNCAGNNNVPVAAVTDVNGHYFFGNLGPGNYCVSINAASPENAAKLLPGDWTFPGTGIWYQDVLILTNDNAYPVNFGWDYQLR